MRCRGRPHVRTHGHRPAHDDRTKARAALALPGRDGALTCAAAVAGKRVTSLRLTKPSHARPARLPPVAPLPRLGAALEAAHPGIGVRARPLSQAIAILLVDRQGTILVRPSGKDW